MIFLAPMALFGLALLALPVLVHLFKPRKMRQTPFSSLRWLKETHQRLSRRVQWHDSLLFLLRAGIIALLVLALARPLVGVFSGQGSVDRFVVVDVGRAMSRQTEAGKPLLEAAHQAVANLVRAARPGDRTAILAVDARAHVVTPPVVDAAAQLPSLRALPASGTPTRLETALPIVRALMEEGRDVEVVFVTANQPQAWKQATLADFVAEGPASMRARVIEIGGAASSNAWIADARLQEAGEGDRILRIRVGGEAAPGRRVRLSGVQGHPEDEQSISAGEASFRIPASVNLAGQVAELRLLPADAMPDDDVFYVQLDTANDLHVLLVGPEAAGRDGRSELLYLRAGLEALASGSGQPVHVESRAAARVSVADIDAAGLVVLADVPELSDTITQKLQDRVEAGAGLAVFLGPQIKPAYYRDKLYRAIQPAAGLAPLAVHAGPDSITNAGAGELTGIRWDHPLLSSLRDPVMGDLASCRFSRHARLEGQPGAADSVLARFGDGTPALVEHPVGAGRVLFLNMSPTDDWSDLPRQRSFVPLLDHLLRYLTPGVGRSVTVGEPTTLALPQAGNDQEVHIAGPDGTVLTPRLRRRGNQNLAYLSSVPAAGVYRIQRDDGSSIAFVANTSRGGGQAGTMDHATLRRWWAPLPMEIEDAGQMTSSVAPSTWPLWPTLVALAGVLLLLETLYVAHRCPRAAPTVAQSVVHRQSILRPLHEIAAAEKP